MIRLGKTIRTGIDINMDFKKRKNNHGLVLGDSGGGKTYCLQHLFLQWIQEGYSVIVLDYSGSFKKNQLVDKLLKAEVNGVLQRKQVYTDGLTVNLAVKQMLDIENKIEEKDLDTIMRMSNVLQRALELTEIQKNIVFRIIKEAYCERKITHFQDILFYIVRVLQREQQDGDTSGHGGKNGKNILNKMEIFTEYNVFRKADSVYWDNLRGGEIVLFDFSYYEQNIQKALFETVLWDLWGYWSKKNKKEDIILVLDECQIMGFSEQGILERLLTQGRKVGLNVWIATQGIAGNFNKRQKKNLFQVATKMYFRPSEADRGLIEKQYGMAVANQVSRLRQGECFFDGEACGFDNQNHAIKTFVKIPKIE